MKYQPKKFFNKEFILNQIDLKKTLPLLVYTLHILINDNILGILTKRLNMN